MNRWSVCGTACALLCASHGVPALAGTACNAGLPLGRIERVEVPAAATAAIRVSGDGMRVPVQPYLWLCPGDRFELGPGTRIVAVLASGAEQIFVPGAAGPVAATAAAEAPGLIALLGEVLDRLGAVRKPAALFNQARDPGQKQPPLKADALLPPGEQWLPSGYPRVALLWRGGPGIVAVPGEAASAVTVSSGRRAYALVDLPRTASTLELRLMDQDLVWQLHFSAEPVPDGSNPERLARAVQLLRDGPQSRRLFALSELAQLSALGYYAAEQLWAAARSGELAQALVKP